jgi:hypothetical protein
MPSVHVDNLGEMAIIECAGKFVRTAAASKLQDAVTSHEIRLKLFNPSELVREKLKHVDFEIATLEQIMSLLGRVDSEYACALLESQFPFPHLSRYA